MTHEQKIAQRIRQLCEEHQLTPAELARLAHMSPATIRRILDPEATGSIHFKSVYKICRALDISLQDFFTEELFALE